MALDRDIQTCARSRGLLLAAAPPARWLTERGHLNPIVQRDAPVAVIDALDELHAALGGDRRALARGRDVPVRPGLVVAGTGQIVQVDDIGHLTSDRLASLAFYPAGARIGFSLEQYRAVIETCRERAARVFTKRWSADFDFAGGRRARRAYEDALRDLLVPIFTGLPLLRIAAPDPDPAALAVQLAGLLA